MGLSHLAQSEKQNTLLNEINNKKRFSYRDFVMKSAFYITECLLSFAFLSVFSPSAYLSIAHGTKKTLSASECDRPT